MLDICDNFRIFTVHVHLALFIAVLLTSALIILKYFKMDLFEFRRKKSLFSQCNFISSRSLDLNSNERQLAKFSNKRRNSSMNTGRMAKGSSLATEKCKQCEQYEEAFRLSGMNGGDSWCSKEVQALLNRFEAFIERIMDGYDAVVRDKDVLALHMKNLTNAYDRQHTKLEKAQKTIADLEKNERFLMAQLSKYEMIIEYIQERTQAAQERAARDNYYHITPSASYSALTNESPRLDLDAHSGTSRSTGDEDAPPTIEPVLE